MSQGISSALERFRRSAGTIFGMSPDIFGQLNHPRATIPEIRRLLGISMVNGRDVYATFPPILFPEDRDGNMTHVFLNPVLFRVSNLATKLLTGLMNSIIQVARVIIYGDSFLSWTPESRQKLFLRSTGTYRHEDGRDIEATSGLIAMIAVMVSVYFMQLC